MFCSDDCKDSAMKLFHCYECPIVERLLKSGIMQLAMRIFFQSLAIFGGSVDDLKQFLESNSDSKCMYDFDFSSNDELSKAKSNLLAMYHLTRSNDICLSDSPEKLLIDHPALKDVWLQNESFIRMFITRILQVGDCNFHGICGWSIKKEIQQPQMIGIACYPYISLVNHSCAPNVNRIYVEGKMFLLCERPIKKGEQLFDCYKATFFTQLKAARQQILLNDYCFNCDCEACRHSYPLYHGLKSFDKKLHKYARKCKDELSRIVDKNQAKKKFAQYCDLVQAAAFENYPSSEVILLQECILHTTSIVIKPKLLLP